MAKREDKAMSHGVACALYSGGPGEPYYQPIMECMCGFSTGRQETWEEVGRLFDEHMSTQTRY